MKKLNVLGLMSASVAAFSFGMVVNAQDVTADNNLSTCLSGSDATCKLTANVNVSSKIEVTRNVTIDLNGHTITGSVASDYVLVFDIANGNFTITDSAGTSGKIENTNGRGVKVEQGTLTVEKVTITSKDRTVQVNPQSSGQKAEFVLESGRVESTNATAKSRTIFLWGDNANAGSAKATINGGEVVAPIGTKDSVAINVGNDSAAGTELVVNGGTITGYNGVRVYGDGTTDANTKFTMNGGTINAVGSGVITSHDNSEIYLYGGTITAADATGQATVGGDAVAVNHDKKGKLVIGKEDGNGPTIIGETGVAIKKGDITIQGGSVTANGVYRENPTQNDNGTEDTGAAISITTTDTEGATVNITGGKLTSENGNAYYEGVASDRTGVTSQVTETISGGEFTSAEGKPAVVATNSKFITGGTFSSNVTTYTAANLSQSQSGVVGKVSDVNVTDFKNGTVTSNKENAAEGEDVTLTIKPADGYVLDKLVVTDSEGNEIEVIDGVFVMPGSDVTVKATFVAEEEEAPETFDAGLTYVGLALIALGTIAISVRKLRNN